MANEIVKYNNRLNSIPLRRFKPKEMDLFFSIASRVYAKDTNEVKFSFEDLRELSRYGRHTERFVDAVQSTNQKLLQLTAAQDDGVTITGFVLFNSYVIDRKKETLTIRVNPEFKGIFNELSNWTRFALEQFASLKSGYSKTMFRLLKQFRTTGWRRLTMAEFRYLLDIPKSYKTGDIDKNVLKPIRDELPPMFKGLGIRKIRGGRGGKITGYSFEWQPEAANADDSTSGKIRGPQKRRVGHKKRQTPQPAWADPNYRSKPAKPTDPKTAAELQQQREQLQETRRKYQAETAAATKGGK